jgi:hypothetical protein
MEKEKLKSKFTNEHKQHENYLDSIGGVADGHRDGDGLAAFRGRTVAGVAAGFPGATE